MSDEMEALLLRLAADEDAWAKLREAAGRLRAAGWFGRAEVLASEALDALDPVMRPHFAQANAILEGLASGAFPGAGFLVMLLLSLAEGPGLSALEGALRARRREIEGTT